METGGPETNMLRHASGALLVSEPVVDVDLVFFFHQLLKIWIGGATKARHNINKGFENRP